MQPSPNGRRVGIRIVTFEARSGCVLNLPLRTVSRSPVRRQSASELPGIRVATHILLATSEAPAGCAIDTIHNEPDQGGVNTNQPRRRRLCVRSYSLLSPSPR